MPKLSMDIVLDKNTSAKLRAISKHTAALADELERIDAETCPGCGELCEVTEYHADGMPAHKSYMCHVCGYIKRESTL
ncbi:hypothetical protein [Oceanobacillus kimchii]|uniref:hypothetical protein n=1 Tax=Oceanobacillus kimchii TaxID=746691 RepID=UPI0023313100|nr:hypothetical protein [Oceanobacillus kimchii]